MGQKPRKTGPTPVAGAKFRRTMKVTKKEEKKALEGLSDLLVIFGATKKKADKEAERIINKMKNTPE